MAGWGSITIVFHLCPLTFVEDTGSVAHPGGSERPCLPARIVERLALGAAYVPG
jgi:hypothetical protein